MHSNTRDSFKSKFGAIAALAGSAVGLGNIWKFPYEAGSNGGGAFLIVYIFFTLAIGFPVVEFSFPVVKPYSGFLKHSGGSIRYRPELYSGE